MSSGQTTVTIRTMAKDPQSRKMAEALLNLHIRKAEKETLRDPKIREMVERLRKMYHEDQEGIFTAFAITAQSDGQTSRPRGTPPPSKIPDLLLVLSELAERSAEGEAPKTPKPLEPLLERERILLERASQQAYPQQTPRVQEDERQRELKRIIEQAKKDLALLKKKEHLVKARKGNYGITAERLKAERLLRELPAEISQMEHTLRLLRDGIL
ncbi:MAG: hypothetical protein ABIH23_17820 [bacterium]